MILTNIPLDIVNYILSYDNRFVIRKGKIILIGKINKNLYNFLDNKPLIYSSFNVNQNMHYFRSILLFDNYEIEYSNQGDNIIWYRFRKCTSKKNNYKNFETQIKLKIYT